MVLYQAYTSVGIPYLRIGGFEASSPSHLLAPVPRLLGRGSIFRICVLMCYRNALSSASDRFPLEVPSISECGYSRNKSLQAGEGLNLCLNLRKTEQTLEWCQLKSCGSFVSKRLIFLGQLENF